MEKTHLRDTRYFRRCCSSLKHSNLKSVNQGPNARVWAHTQILQTFLWHASTDTRWRFRLPLSVTPCSHRAGWQISACPPTHHPRHDHFLDRFFQGAPSTDPLERSWRHSQCWGDQLCWAWSAPGPKTAPPGPKEMSEQDAKAGCKQELWDGGRADTDWMDAASAQPWEGGGNCIIWREEIKSDGFKWKLFSPVQMSPGTKFSC